MCVRKLFSFGVYSFFKLVLVVPLFPETEYIATKQSIPQTLNENGFNEKYFYIKECKQYRYLNSETFKVLKFRTLNILKFKCSVSFKTNIYQIKYLLNTFKYFKIAT